MFYKRFIFGKPEGGNGAGSEGGNETRPLSGNEVRPAAGAADAVCVRAADLYEPGRGYGFVTEKNRREQERLRVPELNSAFEAVYWYQDQDLTLVEEDGRGCFLDSDGVIARLEKAAGESFEGEKRRIPLSFKVDVPHQGNYKVTVEIRSEHPMKDVLIFTERRHLGFRGDVPGESFSAGSGIKAGSDAQAGSGAAAGSGAQAYSGAAAGSDAQACSGTRLKAEAPFTCTMIANVCDIVPRGHTEVYEDKTLDVTVVADRPAISAVTVEEVECPTVFIAGDSTVTDQSADYPYAPGTSYSGWGQMISAYLRGDIAVSNHAHSGLTTQTFREEGHYGIVEKYIRPGDYYFCQFGHNDQKLESLKAGEGYRNNLLRYVNEIRAKGAFPVLVTSVARNTWKGNDGTYNDLLEEYADACLKVGEQEDVPVVDLHRRSMDFIVKTGLEASKAYFFPKDHSHSNDYGAYFMAGLVAEEIIRSCGARKEPEYRLLAERCAAGGFGPWPAAERIVPLEKPEGLGTGQQVQEAPLLSEVDRLSEPADRTSALDMVIKTVRFFPTNVYNDMFTDVVGHEWYAGTVECAYQNGMIDPEMVEDGKFFPLRPVTLEEFLVFAINGYKSRKAVPPALLEKPSAYDGRCRDYARPYVRAAVGLGLIPADGTARVDAVLTRGEAVEICRRMKI